MIKAFSISIHASYRHFGYGGSNGCNLFGVRGLIHDGRVFDMKAQ